MVRSFLFTCISAQLAVPSIAVAAPVPDVPGGSAAPTGAPLVTTEPQDPTERPWLTKQAPPRRFGEVLQKQNGEKHRLAVELAEQQGWRILVRYRRSIAHGDDPGSFHDVAFEDSLARRRSGRLMFGFGMGLFVLGAGLLFAGAADPSLLVFGALPAVPGLALWIPGAVRARRHNDRLDALDAISTQVEQPKPGARLHLRGLGLALAF